MSSHFYSPYAESIRNELSCLIHDSINAKVNSHTEYFLFTVFQYDPILKKIQLSILLMYSFKKGVSEILRE